MSAGKDYDHDPDPEVLQRECRRIALAFGLSTSMAERMLREGIARMHQLNRLDHDVIYVCHPRQLYPLGHYHWDLPQPVPTTKAQREDPFQATGRSRGEKAWLKRKHRH